MIELTSEDQDQLAELAGATRQSEAEIAKEALHWFLQGQQESLAAAIKDGDDDFERVFDQRPQDEMNVVDPAVYEAANRGTQQGH